MYRKSRQQITVLILKISVVLFIAKADCQHYLFLEGLALSFSFVWTEGLYILRIVFSRGWELKEERRRGVDDCDEAINAAAVWEELNYI